MPGASAELLAELVAIASPSHGEAALAAFLVEKLAGWGLAPRLQGRNVVARVGDGDGPTLLLLTHIDTVPPVAGWTRDPHAPLVRGGRLTGLGAVDAKASVTGMALAARALAARPPARGQVVLALVCDEETGGEGIEKVLPELGAIDAAVVGEPTSLDVCVAEKGLVILVCTARGVAGHAARGGGVNAVHAAAADILALAALELGPAHPFLGQPSLQVTEVRGGVRSNVIPDRCDFTVDIRTTPATPHEDVIARVRAAVAAEVRVRSQRMRPAGVDPDAAIVRAALEARPGARLFGSPTTSDWAHLGAIPAVKLGPGASERSHTADETVDLADVEAAPALYEALARAFLASETP